ncbi:hypothetical protein PENSTE_c011G04568 [Penicillium steckii]|uniref:Methyltransferase domain-containing protein n=1 Tax=Penicillium steckii TaxID=303698 RepID=A0A1V6T8D4_9EURO|nr:hypothetical protein PENSTE_c011G04568 [Penicillium steckii]
MRVLFRNWILFLATTTECIVNMGDAIAVDPDFYTMEEDGNQDDFNSETTSIASTIAKGIIENGRRYQAMKENDYWSPSDEQQFESLENGHMVCLVLDYHEKNPLHRSPIKENPKHILDIGTGKGSWAIDMADSYPSATVRGVDIFPPPVTWMPPNCIFEVDDVLREWTWREPFDLIHLRILLGAFDDAGWTTLYHRCYDNLEPGGWIEQLEFDIRLYSDDGSLKEDSLLAKWGDNFIACGKRAGRSLTTQETMKAEIEKTGFVDVHEHVYRLPLGPWAKNEILKEAGRINYHHWSSGLEGYAMWLLTKFGAPEPWTTDEVHVYLASIRKELADSKIHAYQYVRRVWARKPTEKEAKTMEAEVKVKQEEKSDSVEPNIKQEE